MAKDLPPYASRRASVDLVSVGVACALALIAGAWVWYLMRSDSTLPSDAASEGAPNATPKIGASRQLKEQSKPSPADAAIALPAPIPVTPYRSPSADVVPQTGQVSDDTKIDLARIPERYHAQVQSVVEASRTGSHPERLTPTIAPAPFDAQAFRANPQAYLNVVEPGRVYQSLPGGADTPATRSLVPFEQQTVTGKAIPLQVKTAPKAPVTFTTFDGGIFDNHLGSITVLSDADGLATVHYTPTEGVVADVNILAASPMAAYQAHLRVIVPVSHTGTNVVSDANTFGGNHASGL